MNPTFTKFQGYSNAQIQVSSGHFHPQWGTLIYCIISLSLVFPSFFLLHVFMVTKIRHWMHGYSSLYDQGNHCLRACHKNHMNKVSCPLDYLGSGSGIPSLGPLPQQHLVSDQLPHNWAGEYKFRHSFHMCVPPFIIEKPFRRSWT